MAPRDLTKAPIRSRIEARLLDCGTASEHRHFGEQAREVVGAMTGTVVEIGPGTGANLEFYGPDVRVLAYEPNPHLHDDLRRRAAEHGVDLEIREAHAERLELDDASVDGAVATLVLCGVDDPRAVVAEIRRVLKPGARFFFVDHVAAPSGSTTRRVQALLKRPHRWMFQGCETDRDTAAVLRDAGFADLDIAEVDLGPGGIYLRHRIVGVATR